MKSFYLGILFAFINGTTFPVSAILLSNMIFTLATFYTDPSTFREDVNLYSWLYVALASYSFISLSLYQYFFGKVGEGLTY